MRQRSTIRPCTCRDHSCSAICMLASSPFCFDFGHAGKQSTGVHPEHFGIMRVGERLHLQRKTKMRTYLVIAAAAAMLTSNAVAQPANRDATTPAVNTPNTAPNPGAPVAGSNSFTEGQAKSRIEFERVRERERTTQGRPGRLAREGRQGRQERNGKPRLSGQRDRALTLGRRAPTNQIPEQGFQEELDDRYHFTTLQQLRGCPRRRS